MSTPATRIPSAPSAPTGSRSGPEKTRRTSGFVDYVIGNPDGELGKWFIKPNPEEAEAASSASNPATYAEVPEELRRRTLLKRAESYCDHQKEDGRWRLSKLLILILTVIFLFPASIVFIVSRAWHGFFQRVKPSGSASPVDIVSSPSPYTQDEDKSFSPLSGSAPAPSPATPSMAGRKPYDFSTPWSFARAWALYIVYIPTTRYQGTGGFKGALLPSQSPKFLNDQAAALAKGRVIEQNAFQELERVKKLHKRAVVQRREELEEAEKLLDSSPKSKEYEDAVKKYETRQKTAMRLKTAIADAQREWEEAREIAKTETCAQATSYRGIADWASDAYGSYSNLINAISAVCFVGAGLTYSAIFSATRGNIGLMAWAFSLFIVGLAILITVQSLLMWCSRLENYPFSTPTLWEFFLGVGVYGACAAVVTAIALLVVTVLSLHFNVTSDPYVNGNAANWDAHLVFNVSPRYAAIVAFSFIGAGVIVAFLVFALFAMANSVKLLLWRRSIERSRKPRTKLDDLV